MNRIHIVFFSAVFSITAFLLSAPSAFGQFSDTFGGFWNNASSATAGMMVQQWIQRKELEKMIAKKRGTAAAGKPTSADTQAAGGNRGTPPTATGFTQAQIDAAVQFRSTGTQLKTRAFADALGGTAAERNALFQLLSTLLSGYEGAAKARGRSNDIAMALAFSLVSNSSIYNGTPLPDDSSMGVIRDAIAELMVANHALAGVNDLQKQEMYETLVVFSMLAKYGFEDAKKTGDNDGMMRYRQLAGHILQKVAGMPPEQVRF